MSTFEGLNYEQLKKLAREFHEALPSATPDEADNGFKCFSLAWMNRKEEPHWNTSLKILMEMVAKEFTAYQALHPDDFKKHM